MQRINKSMNNLIRQQWGDVWLVEESLSWGYQKYRGGRRGATIYLLVRRYRILSRSLYKLGIWDV